VPSPFGPQRAVENLPRFLAAPSEVMGSNFSRTARFGDSPTTRPSTDQARTENLARTCHLTLWATQISGILKHRSQG
jgi:hypothetical protein